MTDYMDKRDAMKVKERDRERLRELKKDENVKDMLVAESIIENKAEKITYDHIFQLMKRDDYEEQSHEAVPIWTMEKEYYDNLAGNNTPVHRVVTDHIDLFEEELKHKGGRQK